MVRLCELQREGDDQIDGFGAESSSTSRVDLNVEFNRLETFLNWSNQSPVRPEALAKDGFYFLGPDDRVQCIFCKVVLRDWEPGDIVREEHQRYSFNCDFVSGARTPNVPFYNKNYLNPFDVSMSSWKNRLQSYQSWPKAMKQQPRDLAATGFYYKGRGDIVQCFCCGGIVKQWEASDDPWLEHMKHFPLCPHLRENIVYHITAPSEPSSPSPTKPVRVHRSTSEIAMEAGYREDLISVYRRYLRSQGIQETEDPNVFIEELERFKVQPETQEQPDSGSVFTVDGTVTVFDRKKRRESVSSFCSSCSQENDHPDCCYTRVNCGHCLCCEASAIENEECPVEDCRRKLKACLKVPMESCEFNEQHSKVVFE